MFAEGLVPGSLWAWLAFLAPLALACGVMLLDGLLVRAVLPATLLARLRIERQTPPDDAVQQARRFFARARYQASVALLLVFCLLALTGGGLAALQWVDCLYAGAALGLALAVAVFSYLHIFVHATDQAIDAVGMAQPASWPRFRRLKNLVAALAGAANALLAAGFLACLWPLAAPETAADRLATANVLLYLAGAVLAAGVYNVYATHKVPAAEAATAEGEAALDGVAKGVALYVGASYTAQLAAVFVPLYLVLHPRAASTLPDASSLGIADVVALLAPLLAGLGSVLLPPRRRSTQAD